MFQQKNTFLQVIPTLTLICHSFWHIIWKDIRYNLLPFYLASILTSYLASFVASILIFSLAFYLALFLPYVLAYVPACNLAFYLTFYSGILFGISSDILFWHSIWYILGESSWLRSGGEHSDLDLAVRAWRGTLRSRACSWGPAGITVI